MNTDDVRHVSGISAVVESRDFRHEYPFDTNGIVYYLSTQGGQQAYVNPGNPSICLR